MPLKYTEDVDTLLSRLFFESGTGKEKRCIWLSVSGLLKKKKKEKKLTSHDTFFLLARPTLLYLGAFLYYFFVLLSSFFTTSELNWHLHSIHALLLYQPRKRVKPII